MTTGQRRHAAVEVAKAQREVGAVVHLSTGIRARIRPVSAKLLDQVQQTVPQPEVPKQYIEALGREEENPLHPAYLRAIEEANHERGKRTTEALLMFGVELVAPIPPMEEWLPRLSYMVKRGNLSMEEWDLSDPMDVELLYKSFIAVAGPDLFLLAMASGLTQAEVAKAEDSFRSQAERRPDTAGGDKEPA